MFKQNFAMVRSIRKCKTDKEKKEGAQDFSKTRTHTKKE